MSQSFHKIIFLFLAVSFLTAPAFGLKLAGSGVELTADPCAYPYTYYDEFDAKDQLVVWIDGRDDVNWVPRVYATYMNDSNHTEYLIDVNAQNAYMIRTDGRTIIYNVIDWNTERQMLRVADINDINNPVTKDVNIIGYSITSIDIDDGVAAYCDQDYYCTIYAFKAADVNNTRYIVKQFTDNDYINGNIALDGDLLSYCGQDYDDVNYVWLYYLETVNIADLNNPVVTRNYLPRNYDTGQETIISNLDASGDWLVAYGSYLGTYGVFGIHNYRDTDSANWSYTILSEITGKEVAVRTDEPFAVWVQDDRSVPQNTESSVETQSEGSLPSINLMGAILFSNGMAAVSILKDSNDPNWTLNAAVVGGDKAVWGSDFYHYDDETEIEEYYSDLFGETMLIECGDKGYSLADMNHDCKVDFVDFAMFAERWLVCTDPADTSCIDGEVYWAGDNLWRVVMD
ncbi:MAG: hypothetical protein WC496_01080 [Phycisphaerae bacterium]|jgi:hypothetical protein